MPLLRTIGLAVLWVLLVVSAVLTTAVVGMDQTALDAGFMTETLAEEDAYTALMQQVNRSDLGTSRITAVLGPALLRNQTEVALPAIYAYLQGDRDRLVIPVPDEVIEDRISQLVTTSIREDGLARFDPQLARMAANRTAYAAVRQAFREQQYQRIQAATTEDLNRTELAAALEQREPRIRQRLLGQVNATGNSTIASIRQDLVRLKADALLDEDLGYDRFSQRLDAIIQDLRTALSGQGGLQVPDQINVTQRIGPRQQRQLELARTGVTALDRAGIGLPVLTLAIAAIIWLVAATTAGALLVIGSGIAVAGLVSTAALVTARREGLPMLHERIADTSVALAQALTGVLRQALGIVLDQSLLVVLVGIVLLVTGFLLRHRP